MCIYIYISCNFRASCSHIKKVKGEINFIIYQLELGFFSVASTPVTNYTHALEVCLFPKQSLFNEILSVKVPCPLKNCRRLALPSMLIKRKGV